MIINFGAGASIPQNDLEFWCVKEAAREGTSNPDNDVLVEVRTD
jgi:hypothetical protein